MPLVISDHQLQQFQYSETEMRIEIAAHFYQNNRMSIKQAMDFTGLSRIRFMDELAKRKIAFYTDFDFMADMITIEKTIPLNGYHK